MILFDCVQGSDQWIKEKLGKPSASNASKIITNSGERSKQAESYMYELAAEVITQHKFESYQNENMLMGIEREKEARRCYEFLHDVEVKQAGIIYKDESKKFLCSPDGIINGKYGLELKNVLPKTQVKYLLDDKMPSEYFSQVQFSLFVSGFNFWDFMSYSPGLKPLIITVERDEKFLEALEIELEKFCQDLKEIIEKIK